MKHILFKIIAIILFISPNISFSKEVLGQFDIYYNKKEIYRDLSKNIEKAVNSIVEKNPNKIPPLVININIGPEFDNYSHTNGNSKECVVNINYKNKLPIILTDFNEDIEFVLAHEIGHCILGKSSLLNDSINWNFEHEKSYDEIILKLTNLSFSSLDCLTCFHKNFKIAPPLVVYHEIFADIFALSYFILEYKRYNISVELSKYRINSFYESPASNPYASFFAIPFLMESTKYSLNDIENISQKGFIKYLDFIKKYSSNYNIIEKGKNHE